MHLDAIGLPVLDRDAPSGEKLGVASYVGINAGEVIAAYL